MVNNDAKITFVLMCDKNHLVKHKLTNVGRIALERQAMQFNSVAVASINFSLYG